MSYPGPPYWPPEYDYPVITFERTELRRARIPHWCGACSQAIRPGQSYTRTFAIVDGEPSTQLTHGRTLGECVDPNA